MKSKYSLPKNGGLIMEKTPKDMLHRYEKIPTYVFDSEELGVKYAVDEVVELINNFDYRGLNIVDVDDNHVILGLSTGRTPLGFYSELLKRYEKGEVSFKNVEIFTLDELYPMSPKDINSRNYNLVEFFINKVDIDPENVHIPNGMVDIDYVTDYCEKYESQLKRIDLMIMGMGTDGQIGFNEAGSFANSRARLVSLNHNSRKNISSGFGSFETTPSMAITMGIGTILRAKKIIMLAWGEEKANVVKQIVEGEITNEIPASLFQNHKDVCLVVDQNAAQLLIREQTPWLVGPCEWTPKFVRRAVVWLCEKVNKPILKLVYQDYISNSLGQLLKACGTYDKVNIQVFNDLQHTITGWPGGKPDADDSTRPVPSKPYPKTVLIFSPHPDDDVISMGGTFRRLVDNGHNVHVAYETSGNIAVNDDVVLQMVDTAREIGIGDKFENTKNLIETKRKYGKEPKELLNIKAAIRRSEAKSACRHLGIDETTNAHFLNLPFYETGGIKKGELSSNDVDRIVNLLRAIKPHQIYAAGDLSDPHGTHRVCIEAILNAVDIVKDDDWMKECSMWLYRGAWQEWNLGLVDMAVPLSPDEMIKKRHAIYRHLSQKDIVPFPGSDSREFWQRAEERTQNTAKLYDKLGMAEYQAIEVFVKMF